MKKIKKNYSLKKTKKNNQSKGRGGTQVMKVAGSKVIFIARFHNSFEAKFL